MKTTEQNLVILASDFAKYAHRDHFYIPEGTSYYQKHLCKVARLVDNATSGDITAIALAFLHDCVEDVGITLDEINLIFGNSVCVGVSALTKDKKQPKKNQIEDSINRILLLNPELRKTVAIVKLADRIANLDNNPPWNFNKRVYYINESEYLLDKLGVFSDKLKASIIKSINNFSSNTTKGIVVERNTIHYIYS